MTNSRNPNSGYHHPAPVITHPQTPAPADPKPATGGKGGGSR